MSLEDIDDGTLQLITSRVVSAVREELEVIAAELRKTDGTAPPLTVDDVAELLGVARSTVYAHWREWGGYKLGKGEKAAIRFSARALPTHGGTSTQPRRIGSAVGTTERSSRGRRGPVLRAAPRLPVELGDEG